MFLTIFLQAAAGAAISKAAATIAASIAVVGASFGISRIGAAALEAIARQPEAAGSVRSSMILAAALIEGVAMFAIVVCFLVLFV